MDSNFSETKFDTTDGTDTQWDMFEQLKQMHDEHPQIFDEIVQDYLKYGPIAFEDDFDRSNFCKKEKKD